MRSRVGRGEGWMGDGVWMGWGGMGWVGYLGEMDGV